MYSVVEQEVSSVFQTEEVKSWYKILSPYGEESLQAYLNKEDAVKTTDRLNENFVDIKAFQKEAEEKAEIKRLAKLNKV